MKAYGVTLDDLPKDCTDTGKYGTSKLIDRCACGKCRGKKTRDRKSRKAKERHIKLDGNI